MRFLCLLFLLVLAGAVGAFAYFNQADVSVRFFEWTYVASIAVIAGVSYLLGMLSGWFIVGLVRRSVNQVVEPYRGHPRQV